MLRIDSTSCARVLCGGVGSVDSFVVSFGGGLPVGEVAFLGHFVEGVDGGGAAHGVGCCLEVVVGSRVFVSLCGGWGGGGVFSSSSFGGLVGDGWWCMGWVRILGVLMCVCAVPVYSLFTSSVTPCCLRRRYIIAAVAMITMIPAVNPGLVQKGGLGWEAMVKLSVSPSTSTW